MGMMLLVGDRSLEEQKFMDLSLECYLVKIGGYTSPDVFCDFCGKKFHFKRELSIIVKIDKLKDHIKVKHKVMIFFGILTELNLLKKG